MRQRYRSLTDFFDQTETSITALARELGISRPFLSQIASGVRQPALDVALEIHRLTGVPLDTMIWRGRKPLKSLRRAS